MTQSCCDNVQLQWTQRVVEHQYADICFCGSCGTVHASERYRTPMQLFPLDNRCVNCGHDEKVESEEGEVICDACELSEAECVNLHQKFAKLHPSGAFLEAAFALHEMGRLTLALKLASAEAAWGEDWVTARVLRLQLLDGLQQLELALDEAYAWSHGTPPPLIWGVLADLEGAAGNMDGVVKNLEIGLKQDPENPVWATDYAEVMMMMDERPPAVRFAAKGLDDPECEERCAVVLAEVGERFYANGQFAEALGACSLAKRVVHKYEGLCWLRARICASQNQDTQQIIEFLEAVLRLNPEHSDAKAMLETFKPPEKAGWFGW